MCLGSSLPLTSLGYSTNHQGSSKMKITRFSLTNGTTNTKAHFDIETSDGIILKGFQVVEGKESLFVRAPKERGKDNQWYDRVILPEPMKSELETMAVDEFNNRRDH